MNPFEALKVQDDEEEFIATTEAKKPPKKSKPIPRLSTCREKIGKREENQVS